MRTLILTLESPLPANSGSRLRVLHLARQLSSQAEIHVAAVGPVPDAPQEPFRLYSVGRGRSRTRALAGSLRKPYLAAKHEVPELRAEVASGQWDLVQAEVLFASTALDAARCPTILSTHNLEVEIAASLAAADPRRMHRLRWKWEAAKTAAYERRLVRGVDAVVATSEREAALLRNWGSPRTIVVPNGVDTRGIEYRDSPESAELLYVGHFGYRPNELAAIELADSVLPAVRALVPEATVTLVGRDPTRALDRRSGRAVRVTGAVDDVRTYFRRAGALVVPLRSGSGTRLKILEAMAAGLPVVATAFAASGLDVRHGEHLLVADTPAALAAAAAQVLTDRSLREELRREARRLVEERYDWSVAARPLLELHREVAG